MVLGILALVILGAIFWWLWQPSARISTITVFGGDQALASYAQVAMRGTYLYILPRDSAFFYPGHQIRVAILKDHPELAAVSLFTEGVSALSIKVIPRTPVARWCGLAPTPGVEPYCYLFDPSGYLYAAASTSDSVMNPYVLYDTLAASSTEPLGATLASASQIPTAFDFARKLAPLGGIVSSIVIRGDEVDDYVASSTTRITYVLGQEQQAYAALVSGENDYNLSDGSIEHLDLRFPGKIYLKKN